MDLTNIIPLGFLVFGGFFVYSLLTNIWKLITMDRKSKDLNLLAHFKMTIISVLILFVFIYFVAQTQ